MSLVERLDSILKSRDIALLAKVCLVKARKKLSAKELMLLNCGVGKDS